jgi:hypothetical protein
MPDYTYLVLTTPNAVDTTAAREALRFLTTNPQKALEVARNALREKDACFVNSVIIFKLEPEKVYSLNDYVSRRNDSPVIFVAWKNPDKSGGLTEHFFGGFEENPAPELVSADSSSSGRASG